MKFARYPAYDLPILLFLASAITGLWPAYDRRLALPTLAAYGAGALLYFLISRFCAAGPRREWTARSLGLAAAGVGLYYVTQLGHMGVEEKIGLLSRIAGWIAQLMPNLAWWKPLGNSVATFLEGPFFLLLGLILLERRRPWRYFWLAAWGVTGLALLLSASRGAWMALLGAGLLWAALHWRPARALAFVGAAALILLVGFVLWRGDISAIDEIPVFNIVLDPLFIRPDRLEVYRNSLALIADAPLTGIGLGGQFGMVYSRYELLLHVPFLYYSHNLFLEVWLEQGMVGMAAWLWLAAAVISAPFLFPRMRGDQLTEAAWAGLLAMLIHGITDARQAQSVWLWLPFFMLLALHAGATAGTRLRQALLPGAAGLVFLAACMAAFWPPEAAWLANHGAVLQQQADLAPGLSDTQRDSLRAQAGDRFEQVLIRQPGSRTANQRLGLLYFGQEDHEQAIPYLERALQANPQHPGTRKALGLAYTFVGQIEQAVPLLENQLNIVDELNYWGWYFKTQQREAASQNAYRLSLIFNPDQPGVQTLLGEDAP